MSVAPDLMAALQGGGQVPSMPSPADIIDQMIDLAKTYLHAEKDPQQLARMTALLNSLMQDRAAEQKEMHAALGGKISPRMMMGNLGG